MVTDEDMAELASSENMKLVCFTDGSCSIIDAIGSSAALWDGGIWDVDNLVCGEAVAAREAEISDKFANVLAAFFHPPSCSHWAHGARTKTWLEFGDECPNCRRPCGRENSTSIKSPNYSNSSDISHIEPSEVSDSDDDQPVPLPPSSPALAPHAELWWPSSDSDDDQPVLLPSSPPASPPSTGPPRAWESDRGPTESIADVGGFEFHNIHCGMTLGDQLAQSAQASAMQLTLPKGVQRHPICGTDGCCLARVAFILLGVDERDRHTRATNERWSLNSAAPPPYQALLREANHMGDAELRRRVPEIMEWACDAHQGIPFSVLADLVDYWHRVHIILYTTDLSGEVVELPTCLRTVRRTTHEETLTFGILMSPTPDAR